MSPFTGVLAATGFVVAILVLWLIYLKANWEWKANPAAPLIIGVLLLFTAFGADVWLSTTSADIKAFVDQPPANVTKEAIEVFLATAQSGDLIVKLIELFVIPLSVAIIATALLAKVDLDAEKLTARYQAALDRVRRLEEEKRTASEQFEKGLRDRQFDDAFWTAKRKLNTITDQLLEENEDLREVFRRFAESGLKHRFRSKDK